MYIIPVERCDDDRYKTGLNIGNHLWFIKLMNDIERTSYLNILTRFRIVIIPKNTTYSYHSGRFFPGRYELYNVILSEIYSIENIKTIYQFKFNITPAYIKSLCRLGSLNVLQHIERIDKMQPCVVDDYDHHQNSYLAEACRSGNIELLEWLKKNNYLTSYNSNGTILVNSCTSGFDTASARGHVEVLDWLIKNNLPLEYTHIAMDQASWYGHVNVLEWWLNSGLPLKYTTGINQASWNGHFNVLEWWKTSGLLLKYNEDAIVVGISENKIKVLEWWKDSGLRLILPDKKRLKSLLSECNEETREWWYENFDDFNDFNDFNSFDVNRIIFRINKSIKSFFTKN
jgi:hypothetical protein